MPIMDVLSEIRKGNRSIAYESIIDGIKVLMEENLDKQNEASASIVEKSKNNQKKETHYFSYDENDEEYRAKI
jgi:hypothetical protein